MLSKILDKFRPWSHAHRSMAISYPSLAELAARKRPQAEKLGTVVAFYTMGGIYEQEKERLLKSADCLGLNVTAIAVGDTGSWVRNAGLKPGILLQQRKILRGPLLYVDVDAVFHRDPWPELASIQSDIGIYYETSGHLLSGTILINDTPHALSLLECWHDRCSEEPESWDQLVLEGIIARDSVAAEPRYSVTRLPGSFCWIFDHVENEPVYNVYIEHLQASREAKKRPRLFGRIGKRLVRRRDRVAEIERILNS